MKKMKSVLFGVLLLSLMFFINCSNKDQTFNIGGVKYALVSIPGGTFEMGSDSGEANEKPVHSVTISSFYMGKYEVTQGLWQAVMGSNPSKFQNGDNYPVDCVSWNDCQIFIQKLNQQTGGKYRLPTEAEWEYAARAGTTGDRYGDIDLIAWHSGNYGDSLHLVGLKQPNAFALYDMLGSVAEFCSDWYDDGYYSVSPTKNPPGPTSGSYCVSRGGGWCNVAGDIRSAFRANYLPKSRYVGLGFRLASGSAQIPPGLLIFRD